MKYKTAGWIIVNKKNEVVELFNNGVNVAQLSNHFECSRNTMTKILIDLKLIEEPEWYKKLKGKNKK